jgi:nucleoside-diphosphate-sugar epimerase
LRLFVYGFGDSAAALAKRLMPRGWSVAGTVRSGEDAARLEALGVTPVEAQDEAAIGEELTRARALLITAPPGAGGCPGLRVLGPALARAGNLPEWTGYLSTTGVYGDRQGRWVFETSVLAAQSPEGARRVAAERDWLQTGERFGLTVTVFRLPGLYGPGRSALDRVRAGQARRIVSPGQVFSRLHLDDLAAGLDASIARPRAGGVYNLCDDEPAANSEVIAYAARLLGVDPPPEIPLEQAGLSWVARRFYAESKRVSNALAKAELGWRPAFPTYREGLQAVLASGG